MDQPGIYLPPPIRTDSPGTVRQPVPVRATGTMNDATSSAGRHSSSIEKSPMDEFEEHSARAASPPDLRYASAERNDGIQRGIGAGIKRSRTVDTTASGRRSGLDWIVPMDPESEKRVRPPRQTTVGERLQPTLDVATKERDKYASKAKFTGIALNAAIGMQVILGALTTGLAAATSGKQTSITIAILGGLATIVASYLARARGSNEPELSITRTKDLEQFIRECDAFKLDHGWSITNEFDQNLQDFRRRFEELLGNANGERKLASV